MRKKTPVTKIQNKFFVEDESHFSPLLQKGYGEKIEKKLEMSVYEVLYLLEKNKIDVIDTRKNAIDHDQILKKSSKFRFKEYLVYKDLRDKGHRVKTGVKYGYTFRVYEKGTNNNSHSKWLVEVVEAKNKESYKNLAGKNRIAHSTRKSALFAIVDEDSSVTYLEMNWRRM